MDLKLLNRTDAKILTYSSRYYYFPLLLLSTSVSANQQVAYKLASPEYLRCARDQPMPGPFPAPPIF